MSTLQATTINGSINTTDVMLDGQNDFTEWYKLSHCICPSDPAPAPSDCRGTGLAFLHVRTPLPIEVAAGLGWNPYQLEVVGYHTYSAEKWHDFTAVVNTHGDNGTFFGSQIKINRGKATSQPYVYASSSTYGGYKRLCFAVGKESCCCTGLLWVRWGTNSTFRSSYPWATFHSSSGTTAYF